MQSIFKIFQELQKQPTSITDTFRIAALPTVKNHKIGISTEGYPMFFIKCDDTEKSNYLDSNLEFIMVQFSRKCQLFTDKKGIEEGIYTNIALKTDAPDLQAYFLDIVFLIIKKLSPYPKLKEVKTEVEKLIELFSQFLKPPQKTIQGLWAELLVIEQATQPDYLIQAWHNSPTDKFDFNDGIDKLEVKSTAKSKRIHNFSAEQLNPNVHSDLIIASVFVVETGVGKNVFDLMRLIKNKIKSNDIQARMNDIVAKTLGNNLEKTDELFFDYQQAVDTLQFYSSENIPRIDIPNIPNALSNVRFDCDLTNVAPLNRAETTSLLHNSLF